MEESEAEVIVHISDGFLRLWHQYIAMYCLTMLQEFQKSMSFQQGFIITSFYFHCHFSKTEYVIIV